MWRGWVWGGGGGLLDPTEREARENQVNQMIAENAKKIADEIKKEVMEKESNEAAEEDDQQRLIEQQKKDLETFVERGEEKSTGL